MNEAFDLICFEKPSLLLIALSSDKKHYALNLCKQIRTTYSHTTRILKNLRDLDLVNFEKKGVKKIIKLTEKGKEVSQLLQRIKAL